MKPLCIANKSAQTKSSRIYIYTLTYTEVYSQGNVADPFGYTVRIMVHTRYSAHTGMVLIKTI